MLDSNGNNLTTSTSHFSQDQQVNTIANDFATQLSSDSSTDSADERGGHPTQGSSTDTADECGEQVTRGSSTDTADECEELATQGSSMDTAEECAGQNTQGSSKETADEDKSLIVPDLLTSIYDPSSHSLDMEGVKSLSILRYEEYKKRYRKQDYLNLEKNTREQASNPIWQLHRAGRVTASVAKDVAQMKQSPSLVSKIMQYTTFSSSATAHGNKFEPEAIESFRRQQADQHEDFSIERCGLVVCPIEPCFGASPDGIVQCRCHGKAVLEVKCPYKYKDSLDGWKQDPNFSLDLNGNLKRNHKYFAQIQFQMDVTDSKFGYFFVYSPANPDGLMCTVLRDDRFLSDLRPKMLQNFLSFVLPELCCRKGDPHIFPKKTKIICICKRPIFGRTIECNTCQSMYHISCIGILRTPKIGWKCFTCR